MAHAATPLAAESPDLLADCAAAVAAARALLAAAKAGLAARNSCLYRFMFGGEEAGPQVMTTAATWRVAAEPRTYRDVGLHI